MPERYVNRDRTMDIPGLDIPGPIEESVTLPHPLEVVASAAFRLSSANVNIYDIFEFVSAEDVLPVVLTGYGLMPGVVRTSGNTGSWDSPGSSRMVHLEDGSSFREQLTAYDAPRYFAYRTSEYTFSLRFLAAYGTSRLYFASTSEGAPYETDIRWDYAFHAKDRVRTLPLYFFVRMQWLGYMRTCIRNIQRRFRA